MACPKRVLEPLTEAEHDEMVALIERAHHYGQLGLQSPPAKKKQNRAASPTPAATTAEKATRRRDELGDRAHEIYYASDSQKAQHFAKRQWLQSTEKSAKSSAEKASAAAMARWDEHERRVQAARGRLQVDHGYIDLSLPALVGMKRSARERAVSTSAAERAATPATTTTRWCSDRRRRKTRAAPTSGAASAG